MSFTITKHELYKRKSDYTTFYLIALMTMIRAQCLYTGIGSMESMIL